MIRLAFFVFFPLVSFVPLIQGQENRDTTHFLPQVEIVDEKVNSLSLGLDFIVLDSVQKRASLHQDIGELLQNSTSVFIKSYGPSGISSMGFRGLGANQCTVYWNDIPLSSPNLGMIDVSLIPAGSFNSINIQLGGGSALFGSGNMTGALYLNNKVSFRKMREMRMGMSLGSYNQYHASFQYQYSTLKLFSKTQLFGYYDKNNFLYKDLYGRSIRRIHAGESQFSFMQNFAVLLSKNQWLHWGIWIQDSDNEIPASLTAKDSDAIQSTASKRIFIKYHFYKNKLKIKFQTSFLMDNMLFSDPDTIPVLAIESLMKTNVWNNHIDFNYQLKHNLKLFFLAYYKKESAISNNYFGEVHRHTSGVSLGINSFFFQHRVKSSVVLSKSFLEGKIPFLYSLNASYLLCPSFLIKSHLSSNYRLPTFNDLYWVPMGNSNLKAEESQNFEFGFAYSPLYINEGKGLEVRLGSSLFHYAFKHRILWEPENGVWHPLNLSSILSQGVETHLHFNYISSTFIHKFKIHYTYTNSTSVGLKMMYVPTHSISASYIFGIKTYLIAVNQTYTSSYYTNMDNTFSLPSHYLTSLQFSKEFTYSSHKINLGVKVNNLFNLDYQLISFYPMPGRSLYLKLLIIF